MKKGPRRCAVGLFLPFSLRQGLRIPPGPRSGARSGSFSLIPHDRSKRTGPGSSSEGGRRRNRPWICFRSKRPESCGRAAQDLNRRPRCPSGTSPRPESRGALIFSCRAVLLSRPLWFVPDLRRAASCAGAPAALDPLHAGGVPGNFLEEPRAVPSLSRFHERRPGSVGPRSPKDNALKRDRRQTSLAGIPQLGAIYAALAGSVLPAAPRRPVRCRSP